MKIDSPSINLSNANALKKQILAAIASGDAQLDMSSVEQVDSTGLAVILVAKETAQAKGLNFELKNAPTSLVDLAQVYGVKNLLF